MVSKIVLSIIVVLVTIAIMSVVHERVAPNIGTNLALSAPDLIDPSTGVAEAPVDTSTSRMWQKAENWVDPIVYLSMISILAGIWRKELNKGWEVVKADW